MFALFFRSSFCYNKDRYRDKEGVFSWNYSPRMANKIRDYTKLAADICAAVGTDIHLTKEKEYAS